MTRSVGSQGYEASKSQTMGHSRAKLSGFAHFCSARLEIERAHHDVGASLGSIISGFGSIAYICRYVHDALESHSDQMAPESKII